MTHKKKKKEVRNHKIKWRKRKTRNKRKRKQYESVRQKNHFESTYILYYQVYLIKRIVHRHYSDKFHYHYRQSLKSNKYRQIKDDHFLTIPCDGAKFALSYFYFLSLFSSSNEFIVLHFSKRFHITCGRHKQPLCHVSITIF